MEGPVLIEVTAGTKGAQPQHGLGSFDAPAGAGEIHAVLDQVAARALETARRVGVKAPWTHASEAFDTGDPVASVLCLQAMGVLSMAEDGCRLELEGVFDRLAMLVEAAPRSRVVIAIVPEFLGHLARLGAHDLQVAAWLRRVQKAVCALPPEWHGLRDAISRGRG